MTKVFAHRGSKGTHPENTLAAIKEAVKVGADGIEVDVHLSKDKELIIIHDEKVDRTTNGKGYIKNLNLKEIKKLDAGTWFDEAYREEKVPTLYEVIKILVESKFKGILNIELKTDTIKYRGLEKRVARTLKSQKVEFSYLYSSFNMNSLKKIWLYDRETPKAWIVKGVSNKKKELEYLEKNRIFDGVNPDIKKLKGKEEFIKKFSKNIRIWTVNDEKDMLFCYKNDVEGIITDFPEKALELRRKYNKK